MDGKGQRLRSRRLKRLFRQIFFSFCRIQQVVCGSHVHPCPEGSAGFGSENIVPRCSGCKNIRLKYLGSKYYLDKLEINQEAAIETLKNLIRDQRFYIKLNMVTGVRQPDKDDELLKKLESRGIHQRAGAVLDLLYSVRCNMFHGHKGFQEVQIKLLKPLCVVLKATNEILYERLVENNS